MSLVRLIFMIGAFGVVLTGCTNLAPKYNRPSAPIDDAWPTAQVGESKTTSVDQLGWKEFYGDKRCLLYTSPSPRDRQKSRMPSSA